MTKVEELLELVYDRYPNVEFDVDVNELDPIIVAIVKIIVEKHSDLIITRLGIDWFDAARKNKKSTHNRLEIMVIIADEHVHIVDQVTYHNTASPKRVYKISIASPNLFENFSEIIASLVNSHDEEETI